jgi:hypothetical protein
MKNLFAVALLFLLASVPAFSQACTVSCGDGGADMTCNQCHGWMVGTNCATPDGFPYCGLWCGPCSILSRESALKLVHEQREWKDAHPDGLNVAGELMRRVMELSNVLPLMPSKPRTLEQIHRGMGVDPLIFANLNKPPKSPICAAKRSIMVGDLIARVDRYTRR